MQSASADNRVELAADFLRDRARRSIASSQVWSAVLVVVLTFLIAKSTVTAEWVDGIGVIVMVALAAAILGSIVAATPLPWPAGLGILTVAGAVAALIAAGPSIKATHQLDPVGQALIGIWWKRITSGQAESDPSFYLVLICLLMWVSGAWLAWCVIRWRLAMLGLVPGAAAFATNLLNFPTDQNTFVVFVLFFTLLLLLWTTYTGSVATATRARVRLMGDASWDFWESGGVAMAGLILLSVLLPPFSTVDRTTQIESSLFTNWAQLQQELSHPGLASGTGGGGGGISGFSPDVVLGGPLTLTRDVVFTYTVSGSYSGPRYFRGLDDTVTVRAEWTYPSANGVRQTIHKNQVPKYAEQYQKLAVASFNVNMVTPPTANGDVLFYPGLLDRVNRESIGAQVPFPPNVDSAALYSIDRLGSTQPASSSGSYTVESEYSTATVSELQSTETNYPDWVGQFAYLPGTGYRSPDVLDRIHNLALQVVTAAGATTPYDEATAIESYLRSDLFSYTLNPPQPPGGVDRLDYFLFSSHTGYCQYFATAMGDMLRSLGIPTRLVNGFGPGQFESSVNRYVVRAEDAHTWVESYFPGYGWIPFEPTNDRSPSYLPISRGATGPNLCLRDNGCDVTTPVGTTGAAPLPNPGRRGGNLDAGSNIIGAGGLVLGRPDAGTLTRIAALVLALFLLVAVAIARYLRPRTVMAVWKRTLSLAQWAGAVGSAGETPLEVGRRLQGAFPEASEAVRTLAGGFVVAAYAPPDIASSTRTAVMEAWADLRPVLLRRVFARVRRTSG